MRTLSPRVLQQLRTVAISVGREDLAASIDACLTPKRSVKLAHKRVAKKAATRKAKTADIREAVYERSRGLCECGVGGAHAGGHMDHFRGGAHKRSNESVEGCWFLGVRCHREKTNNNPCRLYWLERFLIHCLKHGYAREGRETERLMDALELQGNQTPLRGTR